jgi:hypothetical protein
MHELVPIVVFLVMGAVGISFSPIGRALSRRVGGGEAAPGEIDTLRGELADLRAEVGDLQSRLGQLDEVQERLDFAERMLAQAREKGALPGAS